MALDLSAPGASARTEAYQSGGVEVLAIARLPLSARSSDAPARAEAKLTALPAAVAVLDLGEEGLEPGRAAFDPVLGQLAEASRGALLTSPAQGAVARVTPARVPPATVLRDIDGADQDARRASLP